MAKSYSNFNIFKKNHSLGKHNWRRHTIVKRQQGECMNTMVYTKNYRKVSTFSTFLSLVHHGGHLEYILWWRFAIDNGLNFNLFLCYGIGAHTNNSFIKWGTFWVATTLTQHYNCKKYIKNLVLMKICPWNFAHKNITYKKKSPPSKLSIYFEVIEFRSNDIRIFINIFCYDNVDNLKIWILKCSSIEDVFGFRFVFNIIQKCNGVFKWIINDKLVSNKGF
jgi:hypothetical protein